MTTRKKRTTRGLTGLRASDRTAARQREFDLSAQLRQMKRRSPRTRRAREQARSVCGYCSRVKVRTLNGKPAPLCLSCWLKLGRPMVEEAERLAAMQQHKRAEARRPSDGSTPW